MIIVRQVVYIELHTVASFVYFCFFEDGERVFWPLFRGIMANIWDYFWLFRPLGLGDLGLQHQFFCYSNSLWRSYHQHLWVLSKLVLQILEILCCITFFKGADCFNISKAKTSSFFWMISPPVCELENFQVQNYTLSSERESHKHTNNTHVTYSVHLRGSYATETILMKKPYSSVGKSPGETVNSAPKHFLWAIQKFARRAPQSTYRYIVWSKKLAVSCVQRLALGHALSRKNKSNTQ